MKLLEEDRLELVEVRVVSPRIPEKSPFWLEEMLRSLAALEALEAQE